MVDDHEEAFEDNEEAAKTPDEHEELTETSEEGNGDERSRKRGVGIAREVGPRGSEEDRQRLREEAPRVRKEAHAGGGRHLGRPEARPPVARVPDQGGRGAQSRRERIPRERRSAGAWAAPANEPQKGDTGHRQRHRRDPEAQPSHEAQQGAGSKRRVFRAESLVRRQRERERRHREERDARVGPVGREHFVGQEKRRHGEEKRRDDRRGTSEEPPRERDRAREEDRVEKHE